MKNLLNIERRILKTKQFFEDKTPGQILAVICYAIPVEFDTGYTISKPLSDWNFEKENREYAREEVKKIHHCLRERRVFQDDYIPSAMVMYGTGVFGAYFTDSQVVFGDQTSWSKPVIHDWEDLQKIKENLAYIKKTEDNFWLHKITEVTNVYRELNEGNYLVTPFTHWGPLDMANGLRGDTILTDFYDSPEEVKKLLDICADATIFLQEKQKKIVGDNYEGLPIWVTWVPGDAVFLSSDLSDMIAPDMTREFGIPYMQKIYNHFDGGVLHHHSSGIQIQKIFGEELKNMKLFEITNDPGFSNPLEMIEQIYEWNNGTPLLTRCHALEVYEHIEAIMKGRVILRIDIDTIEQGKDVLKFIQTHSHI